MKVLRAIRYSTKTIVRMEAPVQFEGPPTERLIAHAQGFLAYKRQSGQLPGFYILDFVDAESVELAPSF